MFYIRQGFLFVVNVRSVSVRFGSSSLSKKRKKKKTKIEPKIASLIYTLKIYFSLSVGYFAPSSLIRIEPVELCLPTPADVTASARVLVAPRLPDHDQ